MEERQKPFGKKNYGSIPHLSGSRLGERDYKANEGQERIATVKTRDKHDLVIVQEKLDGSNVGVALINGALVPVTRAGYPASTSSFRQHWEFSNWVYTNESRFRSLLKEGERIVGEWLMQAHGTRYRLHHEPFVAFDLMRGNERALFEELKTRAEKDFVLPELLFHEHSAVSVLSALGALGIRGWHGAQEKAEGAVWRVERKGKVDFLAKYVRPDKIDGCYLPEKTGCQPFWNWRAEDWK